MWKKNFSYKNFWNFFQKIIFLNIFRIMFFQKPMVLISLMRNFIVSQRKGKRARPSSRILRRLTPAGMSSERFSDTWNGTDDLTLARIDSFKRRKLDSHSPAGSFWSYVWAFGTSGLFFVLILLIIVLITVII